MLLLVTVQLLEAEEARTVAAKEALASEEAVPLQPAHLLLATGALPVQLLP